MTVPKAFHQAVKPTFALSMQTRDERTPGKPAMDIQMISKSIGDAKELISGVMAELKLKGSAEKD